MPDRRPALPLARQLTLLLVGSALLAVLAMGVLTATQLRRGFSEYLRAQNEVRLDAFVHAARLALLREGVEGLRQRPEALMAPLLGGSPPLPRPGPGLGPRDGLRGPRWRGERATPPDPDPRTLPRGFVLMDAQGGLLWGRAAPRGSEPLEREVLVEGRLLARARFYPRPEDPDELDERDRRFLRSQMTGLLAVGSGLALLAALVAWAVARRWSGPLRAAQAATHRLAQGDLTHRLILPPGWVHDETDALAADLNRLAQALQQLDSSRRRWIAELSHELRTPLTVLRGELEALADGVRAPSAERLAALQSEVSRLTRLADDFSLLARSDMLSLPVHPAPTPAAALLQAAADRWRDRLQASGLSLEVDLEAQATPPALQWLDAERCAQVLDNLLANALAYTAAPGGVRLWQRGLRWVVEDSAPGVPDAAERERLFEPLYRVDPARQRLDGGGSGLGLAIARALVQVQAQGGRIHAEASPLGGLRIVIDWRRA